MYSQSRRNRNAVNVWPGFVDALASVLLVFIFMLLIFVVGQFFLTDILMGRNKELYQLNQEVDVLSAKLFMEKYKATAQGKRVVELDQSLNTTVQERDRLDQSLRSTTQERDSLDQKLELKLREIASLQEDIAALRTFRKELETKVADMALALEQQEQDLKLAVEQGSKDKQLVSSRGEEIAGLEALRDRLLSEAAELNATLKQVAEQGAKDKQLIGSKGEEITRLEALRDKLRSGVAELTTTLTLNRNELMAARDRSKVLIQSLSEEVERTRLAQESIDKKDIRLQELRELLAEVDQSLAEEKQLSAEKQKQLEQDQEQLAQRDKQLTEKNKQLAKKDKQLARRDKQLAKKDKQLAQRDKQLAKRDKQLAQRDKQLIDRDKQLTQKDKQLTEKDKQLTEKEKQLAQRGKQLAEREKQLAKLDKQLSTKDQQLVQKWKQLTQNKKALSMQHEEIDQLRSELNLSTTQVGKQKTELDRLNFELNRDLAGRVRELSRYRSEFFGRLRDVLGDHPDIRVVGDRFLFQSELLFASGSADLGAIGRAQLKKLAATLKQVSSRIPKDINWILRVDGHTDSRPISTGQFPSNWELSTARALSIVNFLVVEGIEPTRLAATGFAEFHPLDTGTSEAAFSRNRRIELKLTER